MPNTPTPLDLDAIRARANARRDYADERPESLHDPEDYAALADESAADVPALVAEVERLREERDDALAVVARIREARPTYAEWERRALVAERTVNEPLATSPAPAWDEGAAADLLYALDTAEAETVRLRAEVTRLHALVADLRAVRPAPVPDDSDALTLLDEMNHDGRIEYADYSALHDAITAARPAPVWDEDAVTEAARRAVAGVVVNVSNWPDGAQAGMLGRDLSAPIDAITAAVLAAVRKHLPVKPSREALIEAMLGSDIITDDLRAEASAQGSTQREPFLCFADAVLNLWPGESRAAVQAEALHYVVEKYAVTIPDALGYRVPAVTTEDLLDHADRLATPKETDHV